MLSEYRPLPDGDQTKGGDFQGGLAKSFASTKDYCQAGGRLFTNGTFPEHMSTW